MTDVPIFIASSVREFKQGRLELSPFIEMLNGIYKRMDAQIVWNRPETSSRVMTLGGSQLVFDDYVRQSELFVLIVGRNVGPYTRHEYEIALERFAATGKPKILPCFLADTSPEAQAFRAELCNAPIGAQFIDPYENLDAVKNQLQFELANHIVNAAPIGDAEEDINRARERIAEKIRGLQKEIKRLEALETSPETVSQIALAYTEMARLVQEYKVEPDTLLNYMKFLRQQHQYDTAIEVGHWLEGFYKMEYPGDYKLSLLKNRLGLCYRARNQYEQAERYYREELDIEKRMTTENPDTYQPDIATTCNNLAAVLYWANRMEEAEKYLRKALEIYMCLAVVNPTAFEPDVAMAYSNLGLLLKNTNRLKDAEQYYYKSLEIRYRLAKHNPTNFNPGIAFTCNNLGELFRITNRKEDAERYFEKALNIFQHLALDNPDAYEPYMATICYSMGQIKHDINQMEASKQYFKEALTLFQKFPHCANYAQMCRDELAALPPQS